MKAYRWTFALALVAAMAVAAAVFAEDNPAGPAGDRPRLTPEQRQQVRSILEQAKADLKPLRESLRAEVQKLRDLHKSGADQEAIKAQLQVVKAKAQALKARLGKLRDDLKAAVPPDVFQRIMRRFHERRQQFLENHPRLQERLRFWREHRGAGQGT